jgi:GNAT superfamily N-acetyltransferase
LTSAHLLDALPQVDSLQQGRVVQSPPYLIKQVAVFPLLPQLAQDMTDEVDVLRIQQEPSAPDRGKAGGERRNLGRMPVECSPLVAGQLAAADKLAEDHGATLDGITVDDAHTAHGLGSLLLVRFEQAAADAGYRDVNLGSGGGYVEHFYVKNGYQQVEYMVVIPGGERSRLDLDGLTVLRERHWEPDDLVLNIAAPEGYSPEVKAAYAKRLRASEVCCIFCKPIAS